MKKSRSTRLLLAMLLAGSASGASAFADAVFPEAQFRPEPLMTPSAETLPATPSELEAFRRIEDACKSDRADALLMMKEFENEFPSSYLLPEVRLMMADTYFFHKEYPLALSVYSGLDAASFSGERRNEFIYRKAFSMLKTGYYDEAMPLFRSLAGTKGYEEASTFYVAYIDYVNGNYDKAYKGFSAVKGSRERGLEAEYYLNQIDYKRGEYDKVVATSSRLLLGDVDEALRPETMRVGALSAFKLGDPLKARPMLEEYVALKGDAAETTAVYTLGTILYDEGEYEGAKKLFATLTDDRDELAQSAWLYLGQIYANEGDDSAAALAFDRAARESWDAGVAETASYNLSVASAGGSSVPFADTAEVIERFLISYPDSPHAATLSKYLANAYYNRRNYQEALSQIDRIKNPDSEVKASRQKILYQLGVTQLRAGYPAAAAVSLREAAAMTSDAEVSANASLWLGEALYARGDYKDAASAYDKAIASGKLGSNTALANYDLGYARLKLGEYAKARTAFDAALKQKQQLTAAQASDARLRSADCLYYTGHYSEAMKEYRAMAGGKGNDAAFATIRLADILGKEGNTGQKIDLLRNLIDNGEAGIWESLALRRLAEAYSERGDDARAAAIYTRLIDAGGEGTDIESYYYSLASNAENLYLNGDNASALETYRRLEASGIPALYPGAVVGIMRTTPNADEAYTYALKVLELPGISAEENEEALMIKGKKLLADSGRRKEGVAILKQLAAIDDSPLAPQAALLLAEYYLDYNMPAEAEKILLDIIDHGAADTETMARAYIMLADSYTAQGNDYLAKLYLESLLENYPGKNPTVIKDINSRLKKLK